jgi:hypothetical protein
MGKNEIFQMKKGKSHVATSLFKNRQKVGKRKFPDFDSNTHNHLKIILKRQFTPFCNTLFPPKSTEMRDVI